MCLDDPERKEKKKKKKKRKKKTNNLYLISAGHHGDLSVWRFVSGHDN